MLTLFTGWVASTVAVPGLLMGMFLGCCNLLSVVVVVVGVNWHAGTSNLLPEIDKHECVMD